MEKSSNPVLTLLVLKSLYFLHTIKIIIIFLKKGEKSSQNKRKRNNHQKKKYYSNERQSKINDDFERVKVIAYILINNALLILNRPNLKD